MPRAPGGKGYDGMQIEKVTYRELASGPGYNHTAIEVTADVGRGEDARATLAALRVWARGELVGFKRDDAQSVDLHFRRAEIERDIRRLDAERKRAIERLRLTTRLRVWRAELRALWRRLARRDPFDLDEVPF